MIYMIFLILVIPTEVEESLWNLIADVSTSLDMTF